MIKVCNLSSGSDGNCTYVDVDGTKLLIDIGISAANVVAGLSRIGVNPQDIDAVLITHEHSDHIKGINVFAGKFGADVYAHRALWNHLNNKFTRILTNHKHIFYDQPFTIGNAKIDSVEVSHDAINTRAFCVSDGQNSFSIITDLGECTQSVLDMAQDSVLVYIESNHDVDLLRQNQNYSFHLKSRILSSRGHLSNVQCANVVEYLARRNTRQFVLSHLSKENNTPELAYQTVCAHLASKNIIEGTHVKIDVATTQVGKIFVIK